MFPIEFAITLTPVFHKEAPIIIVLFNDVELFSGKLLHNKTFTHTSDAECTEHSISVLFFNKTDSDYNAEKNLDKAVIIEQVKFFGISSNYSMLKSKYTPIYSKAYISTLKKSKEPIKKKLIGCNYMGWNGTWKITFNVPVFEWIHKTENLGWIYPSNNRF